MYPISEKVAHSRAQLRDRLGMYVKIALNTSHASNNGDLRLLTVNIPI